MGYLVVVLVVVMMKDNHSFAVYLSAASLETSSPTCLDFSFMVSVFLSLYMFIIPQPTHQSP